MSEDKAIRDGERVEQFLKDEAVQAAFARAEQKYIEEWKSSTEATPDRREAIHARLIALQDVRTALEAVKGDGEKAKRDKANREKRELAEKYKGQQPPLTRIGNAGRF